MNWKRWIRGFAVAMLHGLFSGAVGLAAGVTWKQAAVIVGASMAKNGATWIEKNPVEQLQDTTTITRDQVKS